MLTTSVDSPTPRAQRGVLEDGQLDVGVPRAVGLTQEGVADGDEIGASTTLRQQPHRAVVEVVHRFRIVEVSADVLGDGRVDANAVAGRAPTVPAHQPHPHELVHTVVHEAGSGVPSGFRRGTQHLVRDALSQALSRSHARS